MCNIEKLALSRFTAIILVCTIVLSIFVIDIPLNTHAAVGDERVYTVTVLDSSQNIGVDGATVTLYEKSGGATSDQAAVSAWTDGSGQAVFTQALEGYVYDYRVTADGYADLWGGESITIATDDSGTTDLYLDLLAPTAEIQPSLDGQTPVFGGSVALTAKATGKYVDYQWYKDGLSAANKVAGGNVATLTLSGLDTSFTGTYYCIASNPGGTLVFEPVQLTYVQPKAVAVTITADPAEGAVYGTDVTLTAEISCYVSGTPPTGMVLFYDGKTSGDELNAGSAQLLAGVALDTDTAGAEYTYKMPADHGTIFAVYSGDENYGTATGFLQGYTVEKAQQEPLELASAGTVTYGEQILLIASGGTGTGQVRFSIFSGGDCGTLNGGVLTGIKAGEVIVCATKKGNNNYLDQEAYFSIMVTPKQIQVINTAVKDKEYDGTCTAGFSGEPGLFGVLPEDMDSVALDYAQPAFGDKNASEDPIAIVFSTEFSLSGDKSGNYTIEQPEVFAKINQKKLSVTSEEVSIYYGQVIDFEIKVLIIGFIPGEDETNIPGFVTPSATVTDEERFGYGTGNVLIAGGNATGNYYFDIDNFNGKLTVGQAPLNENEHYIISSPDCALEEESGTEHWYVETDLVIRPGAASTTNRYDFISIAGEENWQKELVINSDTDAGTVIFQLYDSISQAKSDPITYEYKLDQEGPKNLSVAYRYPIASELIRAVTFGFFNPRVEVVLTADDTASGVVSFDWEYTRAEGASEINVQKETGSISSGNITYTENGQGKTATASFTLDADELKQYKGSISFTAADKVGHTSTFHDDYVAVVDTISPTRTVTYSAPKRIIDSDTLLDKDILEYRDKENSNSILYYDTDVTVTLQITEANFFGNDVKVQVVKDSSDSYLGTQPEWRQNGDRHTATVILSGDGEYRVSLEYTDKSDNQMKAYTSERIVVDTAAPVVESVAYSPAVPVREIGGRIYYDTAQTATVTITERNFRADDVNVLVTARDITGAEVPVTDYKSYFKDRGNWTRLGNSDSYRAEVTFDTNANYTFAIAYTDLAYHKTAGYAEDVFTVDTEASAQNSCKITYSASILDTVIETVTFGYYNPSVTITVQAQDVTSGIHYFTWAYKKQTSASDINLISESGTIEEENIVYTDGGKTATASFTLTGSEFNQYRGNIAFTAADRSGNITTANGSRIGVVDTISPDRVVTYSPPKRIVDSNNLRDRDILEYQNQEDSGSVFYYDDAATIIFAITEANFYQADVSVKVAKDGGVPYKHIPSRWTQDGDTHRGAIVLSGDGAYIVTMTYTDRSGNEMTAYTSETIVIDTTAPVIKSVAYSPGTDIRTIDGRPYYDQEQKVTITITERNFRADEVAAEITAADVTGAKIPVTDHGAYLKNPGNWQRTDGTDDYTAVLFFDEDANYTFDISYTDLALRESAGYAEDVFTVDTLRPVTDKYRITYTKTVTEQIIQAVTFGYYNPSVTVTVQAEDVTSGVYYFDWTYTKESGASSGNKTSESRRIPTEEITYTNKGKTATASFTLSGDKAKQYRGSISVTAGDKSDNISKPKTDSETVLVVDTTAPVRSAEYSVPRRIVDKNTLQDRNITEYLNKENTNSILYYDTDAVLTFTVTEMNFYPEDVVIQVRKNGGGTFEQAPANWKKNGDGHTGAILLSGDGEYVVTMRYTDRSMNAMVPFTSETIVIDTAAPERTVSYSAPKRIVDNKTMLDRNIAAYQNRENSNSTLYYDGSPTITFAVTEVNFHSADVSVQVSKNGGKAYSQAPAGWQKNGGVHTGSITLSGDGEYVVTMSYTDKSTNQMTVYQSETIVIDTKAPVIKSVVYSPNAVVRTAEGRKYYDAEQTVTITVTERNFRADDIVAQVIAEDVTGAQVPVTDFAAYLRSRNNWKQGANADEHTATITFSKDANYTFAIACTDLARRKSGEYKQDLFTVDKTIPKNLTVAYSTSVLDMVLQTVTFGFYQAQMTVTVSAEDSTSGIQNFVYSYIKDEGVSTVNSELLNQKLEGAGIQYSNNGKTAAASFAISKGELNEINQFRGTVAFTANDRSNNNTQAKGNRQIIVDNISPALTVEYNQPVQTAINAAYYADTITATFRMTEANFYPEDVEVTVSKDGGGAYSQTPQNWRQNGDTWTSSISLTEEGDYSIAVNYKDRSGNGMKAYTSRRLTLDRTNPVITVKGIQNESANIGDKIGFTIIARDKNLDISNFKPELTAVYRDEAGNFNTVNVPFGSVQTIKAGEEYAYTIENFDKDAVYSLKATAADLSGNRSGSLIVSDSGNHQTQDVVFSINRHGSTFVLDDKTTELVNTYYVQQVQDDMVVYEINVDTLQEYKVELNKNLLAEGADYSVSREAGMGGWNRYTYKIKSSLAEQENQYGVVVTSKDKAGTTAYSDIKQAEISFVVDQTPPAVTIAGMENGGRYQVENQAVTMIPKDDGGKLKDLKAVLYDSQDRQVQELLTCSEEELLARLDDPAENGVLKFNIPGGMNQKVRIICTDAAGNVYDSSFENITVSTNWFVIFYSNTPLFIGSILGVLLLITGGILLLIRRKRKKEEKA